LVSAQDFETGKLERQELRGLGADCVLPLNVSDKQEWSPKRHETWVSPRGDDKGWAFISNPVLKVGTFRMPMTAGKG
jgi:hypothetical protein